MIHSHYESIHSEPNTRQARCPSLPSHWCPSHGSARVSMRSAHLSLFLHRCARLSGVSTPFQPNRRTTHQKRPEVGSHTMETAYELASKIYAWSVFVSLLSVPYRFPWFWILQVCIHRGIVFCQSPIVFQGKSRKQHRDETSLTKVVDDNFEVASYVS